MTTLNRVKHKIKSASKLIGFPILLIMVILIGAQVKGRIFPTPPPPPAVEFGKLPFIPFPKNATDRKLNFSLDTLSGILPTFPDRSKVYRISSDRPNFFSLDKAKAKISVIGFSSPGNPISEGVYQWTNKDYISRKIILNIFSSNFKLSSSFLSDPRIQFSTNLIDEKKAIDISETLVHNLYPSITDLEPNKTKTSIFATKNYTLMPVDSISNTEIIRVDFFQKDVDKLPILYPKGSTATMNFLVGGVASHSPEVLEASFTHQNISDSFSTYPIKIAAQAFEELKQGKAYIASYFGQDTNISIKNVYLAYYIGEEKQEYLMPIIVFEGNNGFFAYVSAIKDEWVNK